MLVTEISVYDMLADERLNDIFTPEAIKTLYNFYYDMSEDSKDKILKYDPIAIRSEWREETCRDIRDGDSYLDGLKCDYEEVLNYLDMHTIFYELKNGNILYREY